MLFMAIRRNARKLCLMWTDNHSKIIRVNHTYLVRVKLLRSQSLSRNTKLKLHKAQTPSILTYESEVCKMTTEEKKTFRLIERKNVRKMYRPVQEGEHTGIIMNKEIKGILQREDNVKLIKSIRLGWYGHGGRMQNQRMPQQIKSATMQ